MRKRPGFFCGNRTRVDSDALSKRISLAMLK
jgi:hypothetical protein